LIFFCSINNEQVQWFKPELAPSTDNEQTILLVAMNTKSIAGNSSSLNFSQVASLFHTVYLHKDCTKIHDEMVELIQSSEGDQAVKVGK